MRTTPEHSCLRRSGDATLRRMGLALAAWLILSSPLSPAEEFIPLPENALPNAPMGNPLMDIADRAIAATSAMADSSSIPNSFVVRNNDGQVYYDSEKRTISYTQGKNPLFMRTGEGYEIFAEEMVADMAQKKAELRGPLVIYHGDTLAHAESGSYNWERGEASVSHVKAKVNGMLVRGSRLEYKKDAQNKNYLVIHNAFVSTEDVATPNMWVGMGKLTVYPGDYGSISRLSVANSSQDMPVPLLGWIPISHSLNPREGYLPMPGAKSSWGAYLLNRYGFLLGNRRVEHGMPVADYVATALVDYRVRRGMAGGLELTDEQMRHKYRDMEGLALYYASDTNPDINPTRTQRNHVNSKRYRIALQALWDMPSLERASAKNTHWNLVSDINILSDQYVLQDFFEDKARINDRPDNTLRLDRRTPDSQTMLLMRFAPNDYYSADERSEVSYYRVRSTIGHSRITYETRNSAGVIRQNITDEERESYRTALENLKDPTMRDYYMRMLDTNSFVRVNSTHEFTTSLNLLRFINVTPKAGGGYTGYYDVGGVGADNRLLGYLGCDFDIKFHRYFSSVQMPSVGINGLYHVIHPYASISHGMISSSNGLVPQVDVWSSRLGGSTINPMPLDLMNFTGFDSWGKWTVWRLGIYNTLSTIYDDESRTILNWNVFLDYNIDNPNTDNPFSNLYSIATLRVSERCRLDIETQTPTVRNGDGFNQYNTTLNFLPTRWLEAKIGYRYIHNHPVQRDANYLYLQTNLRINERYTFAARLHLDTERKGIPIQQFSISRKCGAWYVGSTLILRDNGGKRETGFGMSFTLGETGTSLPVSFF